ncbi:xanthine dehydrogenase family protein subunit M [Paenibacillus sp. AR247]|uniref:FAD binding domain-containing protein n=1 Tax=Paenibacillus sp. AR247 TaxID=1631599 RepID=UPI000CF99E97|nr:FAD binding domain-containing protein [Paenibacillus sp. AR247]PQP89826.1 hypothetical protein CPT76_17855 [Paenibacillus sp. AR247]
MIPFDFEYYRPSSVKEAADAYQALQAQGKHPMYWSGGTEIITMARLNEDHPGAVVDLKAIPECSVMEYRENDLIIGGCVTLSAVTGSNLFPLLGRAAQGVADQTSRNKITLGGNLCGRIYYREAVLPLLVADSRLVIAGKGGVREAVIHQVFRGQIRLEPGEFLLQTVTDREFDLCRRSCEERQICGRAGPQGSRTAPGTAADQYGRHGRLPALLFKQTVKDAIHALEGR